MTLNLNGLIPATVLPMHADGSIDEPALRRYIRWIVDQGPVALAINVDTGEGPHLTLDEKLRVLGIVRDVTDLPIVAGLAGPSTEEAVRQARDCGAAGAVALRVSPIPACRSEPLDVRVPVRYHEAIAEVGLPLILFQLQPALAGLNFEPDTLRAMASVEGVVAIKEASFDARRFVDTARLIADLPRPITLLTGNDNFILESFMLGATGALIGFAAVMTRDQADMIDACGSGGVVGKRLAEAGFKVVCLEQGEWLDRSDYPGNKLDWELKARKDWATSPNIRGLAQDYPIVEDDTPVSPLMYNAVGGSTIIFAGAWPRALPSDFRVRSLDGVADDWPIDYFELLPYFYRTDRQFGVSGLPGDPAYPPHAQDAPMPPLPIRAAGMKVPP